ncbi:vesicle-associated protein 2-2-like [Mangifera indica]|uniref:vesicle-associated protein 2-2-like n=1 Tax=Mangifera indica TaxID=29780 RepID=UPI001CFBF0B7|nr:vesicle-associated protein 2-2-like [Mangifera indica]XP_044498448.1 vesicle-associated protein 2-2-like [Mangifera indica]
MSKQLLEIQPKELTFIFVLKKQSSCAVRLTNSTHNYVAFKVKTTSPKKYCVRPNVGIVMPKSTCDFAVTMQAQGVAPPNMVCKDKFLIQSTVVPVGTTDEDITASMFTKDDGRYIQENKLKVTLISPPNSPVLSPINGSLKQGPDYEASIPKDPVSRVQILTSSDMAAEKMEGSKMVNGEDMKPVKVEELKPRKSSIDGEVLKPANDAELKPRKDTYSEGAELKPRKYVVKVEEVKPEKDVQFKPLKDVVDNGESKKVRDAELKPRNKLPVVEELNPENDTELNVTKELNDGEELQLRKDAELKLMREVESKAKKTAEELKLFTDIEDMKYKLNELESKLNEAEVTISKLTEERRLSFQERKMLQAELEALRSKTVVKKVQVGFPLLFVCMVAFISFALGYRLIS